METLLYALAALCLLLAIGFIIFRGVRAARADRDAGTSTPRPPQNPDEREP
ncbi:hypothetical protein [Sandarakinorhabdus sp. DWP1-3-1]|uniref:hypothetical protein n=1 Tax=Sandarakinorhabdus sp. DWP1-3-1 TaxID=2804627 RepID=UPI003CFAF8A2